MKPLFAALCPPPAPVGALAVAFSGGADSTALLHALHAAPLDEPLRALHVCHHLHPEAEAWAAHCAAYCDTLGVALTRCDVEVSGDGGMEAAARAARYAALAAELAPDEALVTAHHARDQAETFLLQALRGAGVRGLAGMPRLSRLGAGWHWRPWLACSEEMVRAYAHAHCGDWIEDPSNADPNVDRGYLRGRVWPALAQRWPALEQTLARSAEHAAPAARAVDALAGQDLAQARAPDGALGGAALCALDADRQGEVLRRWLRDAGRDSPDHRHLEQLRALPQARHAASPCVAFGATEVRAHAGRLYAMARLQPAQAYALAWDGRGEIALPGDAGRLSARGLGRGLRLTVASRRGGERLATAAGGHRPLKKWLQEHAVAPWLRERMPLVYLDGALIAVADRWQHPDIERLLGEAELRLSWTHALAGDAFRVVATPGLG